MSHRKDDREEWVIYQLETIVMVDQRDRDAISGAAMAHIKKALTILRKRRKGGEDVVD
jgi:hypothetical protein